VFSTAALALCQSSKNHVLNLSAIYAVVLSVLNLSNATKNQKDAFSSFVQSYFSKLHNAVYYLFLAQNQCESNVMKIAMGSFAVLMLINAIIGMNILNKLFVKGIKNSVVVENLIEDTEEQSVGTPQQNNRTPKILQQNELTTKMF
jgi:hypothetical protein